MKKQNFVAVKSYTIKVINFSKISKINLDVL